MKLVRGIILLFVGALVPGIIYYYLGNIKRFLICFIPLMLLACIDGFLTGFDKDYHLYFAIIYLGLAFPIFFHSLFRAFKNQNHGSIIKVLLTAVLCFGVILAIKSFRRYQPYIIPSSTMRPTLGPMDLLIADHWVYKKEMVDRGDMIVFQYPLDSNILYIKRIIGIPGDLIRMSGENLYVNDEKAIVTLKRTVNNSDIAPPQLQGGSTSQCNVYSENLDGNNYEVVYCSDGIRKNFSFRVSDKSYYVLGDNRSYSSDSRTWGVVPAEKVLGKVLYIYGKTDMYYAIFNYLMPL